MRIVVAGLIVILLPAIARAQSTAAQGSWLPPIGLPLPSITSPLPPIGLPLPPIGLAPPDDQQLKGARPPSQDHSRVGSRRVRPPHIVYVVPVYDWGGYYPAQAARPGLTAEMPSPSPIEQPATGILRLDVEPADGTLQLYVDGYFVGALEDFKGGLSLGAGPHNIEIRGAGYETVAFDVKIAAGRTITYRGIVQRDAATSPTTAPSPIPAKPVVPPPPSTYYFIPGCYLGNVPPTQVTLPDTCDLSRLITRKPERRD